MSRVSLVKQLYQPKPRSALEFDFDSLWAPPILSLIPHEAVQELYRIATSLKLSGKIDKKYKLIDDIMTTYGFRKWNSGTNRVTYRYIWSDDFIAKIAIDRVGLSNNPAEFRNQQFLKPFCCKIFEVDPTGVLAFVEMVNPISSIKEFYSVAEDVFNMMVTKIIGRYVADDLGTEKYMNYGVRQYSHGIAFGPVVLDFPSVYPLDPEKLRCKKIITSRHGIEECNGEIDYDDGLNHLVCTKCGAKYVSEDLALDTSNTVKMYTIRDGGKRLMKVNIVDQYGNPMEPSVRRSKTYVPRSEMNNFAPNDPNKEAVPVKKTVYQRYTSSNDKRKNVHDNIRQKFYDNILETYDFHKEIEVSEVKTTLTDSTNRYLGGPGIIPRTVHPSYENGEVVSVRVSKTVGTDGSVDEYNPMADLHAEIEADTIPEMASNLDMAEDPEMVIESQVQPEELDKIIDDPNDEEEHVEAAGTEEPVKAETEEVSMHVEDSTGTDETLEVEPENVKEETVPVNPMMETKEQPQVKEEQPIEVEHWETDTEFMDENGNPIRVEGDSQPVEEDVDLKTAVAGMISDIAKDVKDGKDINYSKYGDPDEDVSRHYNVKGVSNKEYKKSKKKNKNFDDMSDY